MSYLCAGGSYSPAGHFDVKSTFRVFLTPQTGVIWWFPCPLPVTDGLPNGLKNTAQGEKDRITVYVRLKAQVSQWFLMSFWSDHHCACVPNEDVLLLAYSLAQRLSEGHLGKVLQCCVDGIPNGLVKHWLHSAHQNLHSSLHSTMIIIVILVLRVSDHQLAIKRDNLTFFNRFLAESKIRSH